MFYNISTLVGIYLRLIYFVFILVIMIIDSLLIDLQTIQCTARSD